MLQDRGSSACGLGEEVALGSCAKAQDWQAAVSLLFEEGASENKRVDGALVLPEYPSRLQRYSETPHFSGTCCLSFRIGCVGSVSRGLLQIRCIAARTVMTHYSKASDPTLA